MAAGLRVLENRLLTPILQKKSSLSDLCASNESHFNAASGR